MKELHTTYKVSELTSRIRKILEDGIGYVWVEGEISNFIRHSSGHIYFTLKEKNAQLKCVVWRSVRINLPHEDPNGLKVVARGSITVYERGGQYQLTVEAIKPLGIGELQQAFEKLKKSLAAEGLFDTSVKKSIPAFPECIALVTSPTGAAVRDMISVISRRYPFGQLVLAPVKVQGEGASSAVANALRYLNQWGEPDVIIVGRGGGSIEDLWAFNEEETARAIFDSRIPVISAVGHEIDFTIADFVADLRAPTPSVAGELVVPDITEIHARLQVMSRTICSHMERNLSRCSQKLSAMSSSYGLRRIEGRIRESMQYVDSLSRRMSTAVCSKIQSVNSQLSELVAKVHILSPERTLERGYSITRRLPGGEIVRDPSLVPPGSSVTIRLARGGLECTVDSMSVDGGGSDNERDKKL